MTTGCEVVSRPLGTGARAAFTHRYGGVSEPPCAELNLGAGPGAGDRLEAVLENRRRVALQLGLRHENVAWMRQVHGTAVARVQVRPGSGRGRVTEVTTVTGAALAEDEPGEPPAADALVTTTPGLALAVVVADCVPVLLADSTAGVVGVAHAGRPGVAGGVVPALVAEAVALGADPGHVAAQIGPAICGECYEVPDDLQDAVAASVPATRCVTRRGSAGLDLRAGVAAQLRAAGVTDVRHDARCTLESPELYSHRRDGRTGRFAGYAWLVE